MSRRPRAPSRPPALYGSAIGVPPNLARLSSSMSAAVRPAVSMHVPQQMATGAWVNWVKLQLIHKRLPPDIRSILDDIKKLESSRSKTDEDLSNESEERTRLSRGFVSSVIKNALKDKPDKPDKRSELKGRIEEALKLHSEESEGLLKAQYDYLKERVKDVYKLLIPKIDADASAVKMYKSSVENVKALVEEARRNEVTLKQSLTEVEVVNKRMKSELDAINERRGGIKDALLKVGLPETFLKEVLESAQDPETTQFDTQDDWGTLRKNHEDCDKKCRALRERLSEAFKDAEGMMPYGSNYFGNFGVRDDWKSPMISEYGTFITYKDETNEERSMIFKECDKDGEETGDWIYAGVKRPDNGTLKLDRYEEETGDKKGYYQYQRHETAGCYFLLREVTCEENEHGDCE